MLKKHIKYLPLLLISLLSCQQEISPEQADTFIKFYGGALTDEATDMEVLSDGSYAFCGIDSVAGEGTQAILILTDKYGNVKSGFPKYYAAGGYNSGATSLVVREESQGGFLLVGYVDVPDSDSTTQRDIFLVGTSSSGQEIWRKVYGSEEDEFVTHATEMISSNGYVLAGAQIKNGRSDILVMGVSALGDSIELGLNYNNPQVENAIVNYIYNTGEQYLCVCTYDKPSLDGTDILVLNFDDDLSPNSEFLGGTFDEFGRCIEQAEEDKFLVIGNRENLAGDMEIMIYMIEISGILVTKAYLLSTIAETGSDLLISRVVRQEDGTFAITGTRHSGSDKDIFIQFLGSDYSVGKRVLHGASGEQRGIDIELPETGGLVLLGTNGSTPNSMITLIKTGDEGEL